MKTNLNVDTQGLREKILDLAMRGKLVEQNAGDEPASALLEKIKAEKAKLVKEGKIKKSKKLPEITDDEKPFDIPDSWKWVRLGTLFTVNDRNTADDETVAAFVPMSHIEDGYGNNFSFITKQWKEIKSGYTHIRNGEIIIAKITPCFQNRKSFIVSDLPNEIGAATTEVYALKQFYSVVKEYFLYFFKSKHFINNGVNNFSGAVGQQRVPRKYLESIVLPLPPLAEQRRIADKVSELFSQIDVIEKNVAEYQDLDQAMRSKLLDLAMRGKLVEQDAGDVISDDMPSTYFAKEKYRIPSNWRWVILGKIAKFYNGRAYKKNELLDDASLTPVLRVGNLFTNSSWYYSDLKLDKNKYIDKGDLIYAWSASFGPKIWEGPRAIYHYHIWKIQLSRFIDEKFLYYFLLNDKNTVDKTELHGSTMKHITKKNMEMLPIPLPPLAEQRRIVAKLEELFEQLDVINNNLVSAL